MLLAIVYKVIHAFIHLFCSILIREHVITSYTEYKTTPRQEYEVTYKRCHVCYGNGGVGRHSCGTCHSLGRIRKDEYVTRCETTGGHEFTAVGWTVILLSIAIFFMPVKKEAALCLAVLRILARKLPLNIVYVTSGISLLLL